MRPITEFILVVALTIGIWTYHDAVVEQRRANDIMQQSLPVKAPGIYPAPIRPVPKQERL